MSVEFEGTNSSPVVLFHLGRGLRCVVQRDGVVVAVRLAELVGLLNQIEVELELTATIIGEGNNLAKEVQIQSHGLAWHKQEGIAYQIDPRRTEAIV